MIKAVALSFGYCEEATLAYLPLMYMGDEKFKTAQEALTALAEFLKFKYEQDEAPPLIKASVCCTPYKDAKDLFCGKCGTELSQTEFDYEGFEMWLANLIFATTDSWHFSYGAYKELWSPEVSFCDLHALKKKEIVEVYVTEKVLATLVGGEMHKNGPSITKMFKDLENENSISYWT